MEKNQVALEEYVLYTEILLGVLGVSVLLGFCGFTFFPLVASIVTLVYGTFISDFFLQLLEEEVFLVHNVVYISVFLGVLAFLCGLFGMDKGKKKSVQEISA